MLELLFQHDRDHWNWDAIAAISAAAGVFLNAFLAYTVFLAARSVKEAEKSRLIGLIIWTTERIQIIRDDTYRVLNSDLQNVASDAALLHECRRLSAEYQQIAYFVRTKLIEEQYIYDMYGGLFIRVWNKLEPAIIEIRKQNGEPLTLESGALARLDFEKLVRKFKERQALEPKGANVQSIATGATTISRSNRDGAA